MTATATLEFDPEAPVTDELVEATARFTDDTLGGIAAITRGKTTAIGTIDAQFQSNEQGAAIAGPAGKVSMSGDARGAVGNDNEEENVLDQDLANPELQMKLLAELMAEMGKADFTIESVLEYLLDDRDIPGLEKPSVRRMQQLIQVLHFYALQQASLNAQNAQYWVRSEMIQRLYQQLKIAANGPNPEAAFKALIKTERAAITELRQQLTQQGLAKVPLSQLTAIVVARQLLPLEQVFQQQLTKLQDMLKQAVQNNTNMKYVQVLQMQIAQLQATVKTFQSPALKPLMDYARAINAQIGAQIAAQTGQAQNGPARNGQPGQASQINFAALPKFAMTAATMQALTQTLQVSRAMLRVQSEWAQGIIRVPNINDVRGIMQTQTIRSPESLMRFWQQQTAMRTIQTALRPEIPREVRDQVRQAVQEITQLRAVNAPTVALQNALLNVSEAGRIADLNARMQQLRHMGQQIDPGRTNSSPPTTAQPSVTIYGATTKLIQAPNIQVVPAARINNGGVAANNYFRTDASARVLQFGNPATANTISNPSQNTVRIQQPQTSGLSARDIIQNPTATNNGPSLRAGINNASGPTVISTASQVPNHVDTSAKGQASVANTNANAPQNATPGLQSPTATPTPPPPITTLKQDLLSNLKPGVESVDPKKGEDKKPEGGKTADAKKPEETAQRKAMEAEAAKLASQGVEAKVTALGLAVEGQKGLDNTQQALNEEQKSGRKDLKAGRCPVGGKAQMNTPPPTTTERGDNQPRTGTSTQQPTQQPVYRDAAIAQALAAAQDGKTTQLDNGSKINMKAIVKGICEVCTGCGSCGSAGPVKESLVGRMADKLGKLLGLGARETAPAAPVVLLGAEMAAANAQVDALASAQAAFARTHQGILGRLFSKQK